MTHQTNAQRLADSIKASGQFTPLHELDEAADELRRLSAIEQERNQLRAQLAALKDGKADPVGTVFTMEALGTPGRPFCHVKLSRQLPTGTKLYTATPQPAPASAELPPLPEPKHRGIGSAGSYFDSYTAAQMQAYARAALSAGDAVDAQRYRWLADCLNYPEAVTLISDGSLTADALGKAIDTAMRKDKP